MEGKFPLALMLVGLFGGLGIFLYGMHDASEGMRKVAGARMKAILGALTHNRMMGLSLGAIITFILQSSSATTVMLVGFTSAGLMVLWQTLGVILGADIGTAFTVQLIAFRIYDYALLVVGVGALMVLASRSQRYKSIGQVILGFGLIFFGMKIMSEAISPLRNSMVFLGVLRSFGDYAWWGILVSAVFTAIIQSSAATIGLILTLALTGAIGLSISIPLILGANIGTCATALLSSIGTSREAKRVAVAHTLFKVFGVLILYFWIGPFAELIAHTSSSLTRQIANAHLLFNLFNSVIFLPVLAPYGRLISKIIPRRVEAPKEFGPKYLEPRLLATPALALGEARREILRMAKVVERMVADVMVPFKQNDEILLARLLRDDDKVDILEEAVTPYLTQLSQKILTEEESRQEVALLYVVDELEHIGDVVSKDIVPLGAKMVEGKLFFSEEGLRQLEDFHGKVFDNLKLVIKAFEQDDLGLAKEIVDIKPQMVHLDKELHKAHIDRLHKGLKESLDTSTIHLDLSSNLRRINSHITEIAHVILGEL